MCSPWLRLTKLSLVPISLRDRRFDEKILYELHPDDPNIHRKLPYPHPPNIIPFYHTVIAHNIPPGKTEAEKAKMFEDSLPETLGIDYFWCPKNKSLEQSNAPGESAFIVCEDAETATAVLGLLPQIPGLEGPIVGEIFVPGPGDKSGLFKRERIEDIKAWSNIILWAGFVGSEFVLSVGSRGFSKECDVDLRWTVNHHLFYQPQHPDGGNEVTVWMSSVEKHWKPVRRSQAESIRKTTQKITAEIKGSMNHNEQHIGLKLVFEQEDHANYIKLWLTENATHPIPLFERYVENRRWYIFRYSKRHRF